jgi:hypothetical protein
MPIPPIAIIIFLRQGGINIAVNVQNCSPSGRGRLPLLVKHSACRKMSDAIIKNFLAHFVYTDVRGYAGRNRVSFIYIIWYAVDGSNIHNHIIVDRPPHFIESERSNSSPIVIRILVYKGSAKNVPSP